MQAVVRRGRLPGAVQAREFCGADLLRAGGAGEAPGVLHPTVLTGAARGGQEALGHSDTWISK